MIEEIVIYPNGRQKFFWETIGVKSRVERIDARQEAEFDIIELRRRLQLATPIKKARSKTLLLAVTGKVNNLGISASRLMKEFKRGDVDILTIYDQSKNRYRDGIRPLGHSTVKVIDRLADMIGSDRYSRRVVIGGSHGASAAWIAARRLQADELILIIPSFWRQDDEAAFAFMAGHGANYELMCNCTSALPMRVRLIYAGDYPYDAAVAQSLKDRFRVEIHPVEGVQTHGIARWLTHSTDGRGDRFWSLLAQAIIDPKTIWPKAF